MSPLKGGIMTQPYSPHQINSGGVVSAQYPMGALPPVHEGGIPPEVQGNPIINGSLGDIGAANAAVSAAGDARGGAGVLDVPRQGGSPGNTGSAGGVG